MKYRKAVIIKNIVTAFSLCSKFYSEKIKMFFVTYLLHFFDFNHGVC